MLTAFGISCAVFLAATMLDYAMVRYQQAVDARAAHTAGRWSVVLYVVGAIGFLSVVEGSAWFMLPECLGLYVGNVIALRDRRVVAPSLHGSRPSD